MKLVSLSTELSQQQDKFDKSSTATLERFTKPVAMSHQIQAYAELWQQIHGDLRIQHPEWVEPNGESSMPLMELLDTLTRRDPTSLSFLLSAHSNRQ